MGEAERDSGCGGGKKLRLRSKKARNKVFVKLCECKTIKIASKTKAEFSLVTNMKHQVKFEPFTQK